MHRPDIENLCIYFLIMSNQNGGLIMQHKRILKLTMLVIVAILSFLVLLHVGRNQLRKLWFLDNGSVSLQMQEKILIERLGEPNQTTQPIENQRQRILTYTDAFVSFGSGAPRVDYLVNIHTDRVECVMTEIPADSQEDAEKLRDTIIGMIREHYHAFRFLLTESDIPDGCCICLKGVDTFYVSIRQNAQAGAWSVGIEAASQS